MGKAVRNIIKIDEGLCNGCGNCVTSCAEGAIRIVDGKAKLVSETYCDGLGACIGDCPTGALTIEQREAEQFDEKAVEEHLDKQKVEDIVRKLMGPKPAASGKPSGGGGCPGSMSQFIGRQGETDEDQSGPVQSRLGNWPVQLMLAPVSAPYFEGADLLISADCVPFAYGNFHADYVKDKVVLIGCPKLDDAGHYQDKLTQIFQSNRISSVEVLYMEVPCCFGLAGLVLGALEASGADTEFIYTKIGIRGDVIEKGRNGKEEKQGRSLG